MCSEISATVTLRNATRRCLLSSTSMCTHTHKKIHTSKLIKIYKYRGWKLAQQIKVLAVKSENQSSIHGNNIMEDENQLP